MKDEKLIRILKAAGCILLAVLCFFVLAGLFSSPETFTRIIQSIDDKVSTTLKLTASATAASAGITVIPGDIGTPIAERLSEFSEYGFIILCILYAEKYLITVLGEAVFKYVLPLVLVCYAVTQFTRSQKTPKLLIKIAVVSLALFAIIPISIHFSDRIYETYEESIAATISQAEDLAEETSQLGEAEGDQNIIQRIYNQFKTSAGDLADRGAGLINRFVESMAVMTVTSCLIPLAVLSFSLWIIKQVLGFDIPLPKPRGGLGRGKTGGMMSLPKDGDD